MNIKNVFQGMIQKACHIHYCNNQHLALMQKTFIYIWALQTVLLLLKNFLIYLFYK